MFNYLAMTISPYVAVLCFVGAAINYQRSKPWGVVALSGLAFLSFSGSLVTRYGMDEGTSYHMVDNTRLTNCASSLIFVVLLVVAAMAVAIMARFRIGLIVLRAGLCDVQCSLVFLLLCRWLDKRHGKRAAASRMRFATRAKESGNVECD